MIKLPIRNYLASLSVPQWGDKAEYAEKLHGLG